MKEDLNKFLSITWLELFTLANAWWAILWLSRTEIGHPFYFVWIIISIVNIINCGFALNWRITQRRIEQLRKKLDQLFQERRTDDQSKIH